ncbi:MAG: STAS domain-containing protein [Deltaproteobacteria bacterium]|nr:STAS domain-containing protein [Deltaproteobacteria bacterium]
MGPSYSPLPLLLRPVALLSRYNGRNLPSDALAGITMAVLLLPQAIAYAAIAELPIELGIYAAIVGAICGSLWGSCSHLQSGPTNSSALLVLSALASITTPDAANYVAIVAVTVTISGVVRWLMGVLRLGLLMTFVSDSVVVGFSIGAALLIVAGQLRHAFGLEIAGSAVFSDSIVRFIGGLGQSQSAPIIVAAITALLLVISRRISPRFPALPLILLAFSGLHAIAPFGLQTAGRFDFKLQVPGLDGSAWRQAFALIAPATALALMGLAEALAIARAMILRSGEELDVNQEFVGQGSANIAAGMLAACPCSGSFTRSALLQLVGGRTSLANVLGALAVLASLPVLPHFGAHLPRAALAGALFTIALQMVDLQQIRHVVRSSTGDAVILFGTAISTLLFPVHYAVLCGIGISVLRYLIRSAVPAVFPTVPDQSFRHFVHDESRPSCPQLGVIALRGSLFFGAVYHVENQLAANRAKHRDQKYLLLRFKTVDLCDLSGVHMLRRVLRQYRDVGGDVYFSSVNSRVLRVMEGAEFIEELGPNNILASDEAIDFLFRRVLSARYCSRTCRERVFAECQALKKVDVTVETPILQPTDEDEAGRNTWSAGYLHRALQSGEEIVVIDVREAREVQERHIPGVINIPLGELITRRAEFPTDRQIVMVCRTGRRSLHALQMLRSAGSTADIILLRGGMLAWEAAGLPLVEPAAPPQDDDLSTPPPDADEAPRRE